MTSSGVKTLLSNVPVTVRFRNDTRVPIDIFWINFQGQLIHKKNLECGDIFSVHTFETHPWRASEKNTEFPLVLNNEFIFFPYENQNDQVIKICSPGKDSIVTEIKERSVLHNVKVAVGFRNKTQRKVDMYWVDYNGQLVKYKAALKPGDKYGVITYETHPWVARDSESGSTLFVKDDYIFFPKAHNSNEEQEIKIHLPVFTLMNLCLEKLRLLGAKKVADLLEIPLCLQKELTKPQTPKHRNYKSST